MLCSMFNAFEDRLKILGRFREVTFVDSKVELLRSFCEALSSGIFCRNLFKIHCLYII